MSVKLFLAAVGMMLASALPIAACESHTKQSMSCAEGSVWDAQSETCVPQTTS